MGIIYNHTFDKPGQLIIKSFFFHQETNKVIIEKN